jgi:hypothetical protein
MSASRVRRKVEGNVRHSEPVCPAGEVLPRAGRSGAACTEPCALPLSAGCCFQEGGCGVVGATL